MPHNAIDGLKPRGWLGYPPHSGWSPTPEQTGRFAILAKNTVADDTETEPALIDWSMQEIRRIATLLAQRRIKPVHIIGLPAISSEKLTRLGCESLLGRV